MNPAGTAYRIELDRGALNSASGNTGVRVRLVSGHHRDPVVENYYSHIRPVVHRIEQTLNAGVQECGIAYST